MGWLRKVQRAFRKNGLPPEAALPTVIGAPILFLIICYMATHRGPPPPAPAQPNWVKLYGHIRSENGRLVSNNTGQPIRLRGMSLFQSNSIPKYWNKDVLAWLKEDWHVQFVRAAMGIDENGGYLETPEIETKRVETVVDAAIELGLYVIVDWHDHYAEEHLGSATKFFDRIARKYGKHENVLYEVFNEPIKQSWHKSIKRYHEAIVPVIRRHTNNLVILGTRIWSQEVNVASKDPAHGDNLAYTLHIYAGTHRQPVRNLAIEALKNGITIFATEWGTCQASGNGALDLEETKRWQDLFEEHLIWDANWAIGDRLESCAALWPGASEKGNWSACDLTESGHYMRSMLRGEPMPRIPLAEECPRPLLTSLENCSEIGKECTETRCCQDPSFQCYYKNPWFAGCLDRCKPGINPNDEKQWATPWSCIKMTREPRKCSDSGEDCLATGCCNDPETHCYGKNQWAAGCRMNCTPGLNPADPPGARTPWSCERVGPSLEGEDCSKSRACLTPGLKCFSKNKYWASCVPDCKPGIHPEDPPEDQSPWECTELKSE